MDYRALVMSTLVSIGIDPDHVHEIEAGAEIYGDAGILDSVYLVGLIVGIEEALSKAQGRPTSLFFESGVDLLDEFKDINTLVSFLEGRAEQYCDP
jgi:acyl carrier protein